MIAYQGVSFQSRRNHRKIFLLTGQGCKFDANEYGSYDDDGDDSHSENTETSWDPDMDDLMDWFNGTIVAPHEQKQLSRHASMPTFRVTKPTLIGSLGDKSGSTIILNRLENCESEYLQHLQPSASNKTPEEVSESSPESPEDCLRAIFQRRGHNSADIQVSDDLFLAVKQEHIDAHSVETTIAARKGDLSCLKRCFEEGKSLQCCNKHGESIVHIVCRRGHVKILRFLIEKAGVNVMVRDDVGRTPLHDAAWTGSPNFELVKMLLEQVPLMMLVRDSRNHTPLSYVPRQQWGAWCDFLKQNEDILTQAFHTTHV